MLFLIRRSRIGVVQLYGTIGASIRSHQYEPIFDGLGKSKGIKALLLDINSPGGSVTDSEYLHAAVKKVANQKPVIAFVRGLGASGSYLLACGAHRIIAQPAGLLGSIGVISVRPVVEQMLQRLGMGVNVTKAGRLKDMGAFWRSPTEEESEKFQSIIDHFYGSFVAKVSQARKLSEDAVRDLATGEVYTADRALDVGLIDEVGYMDRAIDLAAEMGQVSRRTTYFGPKRSLHHRLFRGLAQSMVESVSDAVEERLATRILY